MRRLVLVAVGCVVALFVAAAPASADNGPHMKGAGGSLTPDTCAACHRAHTAQAPYLLKEKQESLCFTCHGAAAGGAKNDVEDGVGYSSTGRGDTPGALRGGGFKFALIDSSNVAPVYDPVTGRLAQATIPALSPANKQPVNSTHSIDESPQTAWGNGTSGYGAQVDLTCGSCHDPHGNGNYRILRPIPDKSGATTGVTIADTATKVYTTKNYWASWDAGDYNGSTPPTDPNAPQFRYQISNWCTTCHSRYLAGSGSYQTNSGDPVFTYRHRTDFAQADYDKSPPPKARPNCIQCHVSHGSNATMGTNSSSVAFPGQPTGSSDSRLLRLDNRGVCQTCHHK